MTDVMAGFRNLTNVSPYLQSNEPAMGSGIFGLNLWGNNNKNPITTAPIANAATNAASNSSSIWSHFLPTTLENGVTTGGWGAVGLNLGQSLMNSFIGMKQYGIMKDQLKESKRQFNTNFNAQKTLVNSQLEDRQRARLASNPNEYESLSTYMDKNRIR